MSRVIRLAVILPAVSLSAVTLLVASAVPGPATAAPPRRPTRAGGKGGNGGKGAGRDAGDKARRHAGRSTRGKVRRHAGRGAPGSAGRDAAKNIGKRAGRKLGKRAGRNRPGDRDVAAVVHWLRARLAEAARTGESSDLATAMLGGLVQLAIPNLVHGHYALAGTGQAMRGGRMPARDVIVVAGDIAGNFEALGRIFADFAARPELRGQVARVFAGLRDLSGRGVLAAEALAVYAKSPDRQAAATAFEGALERYRKAVRGFLGKLR